MRRGTRIAIIGAGLGGATAAAWLQHEGFPVRVYEQAQSFERIGAGIHVSANVMKVLRRLGADQRLSQIGIHPDIFTSRKWDTGDVLFELPLGDTGERKYGASYITVHRHDLHAAILEKVAPGLKVSFEPDLKRSELPTASKIFDKAVTEIAPYFDADIHFDRTNTERDLSPSVKETPINLADFVKGRLQSELGRIAHRK